MAQAIALPQFSFTDLLSYGWKVLQQHFGYLIKIVLFMIVLVVIPQIVVDLISRENTAFGGLLRLVLGLWQALLSIGVMKMVLALLRTGQETEVTFEKFLTGKEMFVKYLVAEILFGFLVVVGMILLIIPGFYFMLKYLFAPLLIADKNVTIGEAFAMSAKMTEGKKLTLFFYVLGFYAFVLLGLLALVVGVVVTASIVCIAWLGMYLALEKTAGKTTA